MLNQMHHIIVNTVFENISGPIPWSLVGDLPSSSVPKSAWRTDVSTQFLAVFPPADESSPVSESLVREQGRGIWRLELGLNGILEAG